MSDDLGLRRYTCMDINVEACQFCEINQIDIADWCGGLLTIIPRNGDDSHVDLIIYMKNGDSKLIAYIGDYIVRLPDGSYQVFDDISFTRMFKSVSNGT